MLEILNQARIFLNHSFSEMSRRNFFLQPHWHIDHLCFRTSTDEKYIEAKKTFSGFSDLLIEGEVNGRQIATFKLRQPIFFDNWMIDLIEVPAPKKGKFTKDGFEHFEVVCDQSFNDIKGIYSGFEFNEQGLIKDFNQELECCFSDFAIKFHHLSLESVIHLEANKKVYSAIKNLQILKTLKPFGPLVAGAFPLGLAVPGSDVDILVCADNFEAIQGEAMKKFGHLPGFKIGDSNLDNIKSLVISFSFDDLQFEIFAQQTSAVRQRAYLHFLVEERILKFGGTSLHEQISKYRSLGLKTEVAFARALKIEDDPYHALLTWQTKTNEELLRLIP